MADRVPMTKAGETRLREELQKLKSEDRPRVIAAIADAREHGDLKENAEYHAAREQQSFIEGRIQEIEGKLSAAQVIDVTTIENTGKVIFGTTVHLLNMDTDEQVIYKIVGEDEADIKAGKLSISSPIARALVGKSEGDVVAIRVPSGTVEYEIEQVEYMGVGWSNPDLLQISAILGGIGGNDTFRYTDGLPSSGGCVTTWSRGQNLLGVLAPVGLSSVQITLPPNGAFGTQPASDEPNALVGGIDASGIASGNASVTISGNAEAGTLDGTLTRTPSAFSVDAPDLDGDVLPTVPFGDFDVEYSGTLSDAVVVSVIYVSNDNESLGGHDCLGRNGSVTSSPSSLGVSAEDLQYAQVIVSRVRETSGSLSGSANAESEVVGVTAQVGIVLFEEPAAP